MDSILRQVGIGAARAIYVACAVVLTATTSLSAQEAPANTQGQSFFAYEHTDIAPLFAPAQAVYVSSSVSQPHRTGTEVLPDGLLYQSYIAAPNEPRFSSVGSYDLSKKSWRWDASLGGRVGLFRQHQPTYLNLDTWQIDLEGAALPRLNPELHMDVEWVDYRFGLLWTGKKHNLAFKFGYFHMSTHVGDEFLLKNPTSERVNFVRESLVPGTSLQASDAMRYYGEVAWANSVKGGAKPWQFQLGAEYSAIAERPTRGAPFAAVGCPPPPRSRLCCGNHCDDGLAVEVARVGAHDASRTAILQRPQQPV